MCPHRTSGKVKLLTVDRLDRLSAVIGMRGTLINPFFELSLFVQAARGPLLPLFHIFSECVLAELLEKVLDHYLKSDPSSPISSAHASVQHVFPSPGIALPPTPLPSPSSDFPLPSPSSDFLRDILSQSQHKAPICTSTIPSSVQKFLREHSAYQQCGNRSIISALIP